MTSRTLVHRDPGGQSALYETDLRYTGLLEGRHGERFREYRRLWRERSEGGDPGDFPLSLDLATSSGCQLSCVMCPLPRRPGGRRRRLMDIALFRSLMDEARERLLPAVTFGLGSEPLLDRRIPALVAAAAAAGVMDIRLGTNGQALTPEISLALADAGLTRLEVSLDAAGPEGYAAARPGGDWGLLARNVEGFLAVRAKKGLVTPLLRLSFLRLPANAGELPAFLSTWAPRADMISIQSPVWFPESLLPAPPPAPPGPVACRQPWQRLGVLEDGTLWPCCSWHGEGLLGGPDALGGAAAAWASPAMTGLRRALASDAPPARCSLCASAGKAAEALPEGGL
ncbi:MAG: radical SAM protein [Deltaproteobacteria bacterium]|nr:radical SAM protein [Deltaproteobacteria bacterium]